MHNANESVRPSVSPHV